MSKEFNKVALITGAGKGIGRAFALQLARKGVAIAAISRTQSDLIALQKEVELLKGDILIEVVDVTNYEALQQFIAKIKDKFGRLDYVVINAGVSTENASIEESDVEKWSKAIDINLTGAYKTAKATIPLLKKNEEGKIIIVGSGLGHKGYPGASSYSASKAGLWSFTRILAQELIEYNIAVNELIPGPVRTSIDRDISQKLNDIKHPTEWYKEPDDVLPLFDFLINQPKNGVTGQSFNLLRRDL